MTMQLVPIPPEIAFAQAAWDALDDRQRGARILAAIHAKKSSKGELAERLDVSYQAVHAWCAGDSTADWARWMAVCMALRLEEAWRPSDVELAAALREIEALRPAPKKRKRGRAAPH